MPGITSVITSVKKNTLSSSASLIASSAEQAFLTKEMLGGNTSTLNCSDVSKLSTNDYETCTIKKVDGKVLVNIKGKGQFAGKYICNGTKELSVVRDEACTDYATTKVADSGNVNTDPTNDKNIRYSGSNPNNYVTFNGELWRIIGIFNVKNEAGEIDQRIKLIRKDSLGGFSWDSSASGMNSGNGYNVWETISGQTKGDGTTKADLNVLLNDYYAKENPNTSCTYCNGQNQGTCTNTCSFAKLTDTALNMIDTVI